MKKLFALLMSFVIIFCFSSCNKKNESEEYKYLPQTVVQERRTAHGSQQDYKYIYKYDSYGNVVKEQLYTKTPRAWFYFLRDYCFDTTYTYDNEGKILQELITEEHFSTALTDGHSIYEHGFDYYYDENGRLIRKDYIQLPGHSYTYNGFKYKYDENGNLLREVRYSADGTERTEVWYKYDSDNVLIETSGRQFVKHNYDENGNLTYRSYRYKGGGHGETTYTYDEKNRLIKEVNVRYSFESEKLEEITIKYSNFKKIALKN